MVAKYGDGSPANGNKFMNSLSWSGLSGEVPVSNLIQDNLWAMRWKGYVKPSLDSDYTFFATINDNDERVQVGTVSSDAVQIEPSFHARFSRAALGGQQLGDRPVVVSDCDDGLGLAVPAQLVLLRPGDGIQNGEGGHRLQVRA
jgi:hypothetical protein